MHGKIYYSKNMLFLSLKFPRNPRCPRDRFSTTSFDTAKVCLFEFLLSKMNGSALKFMLINQFNIHAFDTTGPCSSVRYTAASENTVSTRALGPQEQGAIRQRKCHFLVFEHCTVSNLFLYFRSHVNLMS